MKDLCQKREGKLFFPDVHTGWLPGTGIVECLEIIDIGCNAKLILTSMLYDRSTSVDRLRIADLQLQRIAD